MRRNQWIALGAVAFATVIVVGFVWLFVLGPAIAQARVATGYLAKTVCSCLFVDKGSLAQCKADAVVDRDPRISRVSVTADLDRKSVRASFLPLSSDTATFEEGFGCLLR